MCIIYYVFDYNYFDTQVDNYRSTSLSDTNPINGTTILLLYKRLVRNQYDMYEKPYLLIINIPIRRSPKK